MFDTLLSKSIDENNSTQLKMIPSMFMSADEIEARNFVLDYEKQHGSLPSRDRFEQTEYAHLLTNYLVSSPFTDIFDILLKNLKKRYMLEKYHDIQEKLATGKPFDYYEFITLGKELLVEPSVRVNDLFSVDRSKLYFETEENKLLFGYQGLDLITGGIHPGEYFLIVARPGVGKSLFCFRNALKWASEGKKILMVSSEMAINQIVPRIDSMLAAFNPFEIRTKENPVKLQEYYDNVQVALDKIKAVGGNIFFTQEGFITPNLIESLINKHNPDGVIVDGVYLLGSDDGKNTDWRTQAEIINRMKQIPMDYHLPLLASTQLKRSNKEFGFDLEDIAYSDNFGQTADAVFAMYRLENIPNQIELAPLKNRNGKAYGSCSLKVDWNEGTMTEIVPMIPGSTP